MRLADLLRLAFSRLGTGKLRAALTMLGVVIGVASVIALVSVAQGATKGISDRLQSLGTNLLTVNAGKDDATRTFAAQVWDSDLKKLKLAEEEPMLTLDRLLSWRKIMIPTAISPPRSRSVKRDSFVI